jgi:RNA polymerase sigma-70 factor, ECF subfamily
MTEPAPGADDEAVLACLERGDIDGAATLLLRAQGPGLLRYLHSVLRDENAACEVMAEVSVLLWRDLPSFRRQSSLRTWAYRVAWHAALRHRRDPFRRRAQALTGVQQGLIAELRSKTPWHLGSTARRSLDRLRASLSAEEQTLLTLRIDQRLSWAEVAAVLDLDEAATRKRFGRLKERLREAARKEGLLGPEGC